MTTDNRVTRGGGNVFADIGLANPEETMAKARVVAEIAAKLRSQGLTQEAAARRLGLPIAELSRILRGHFAEVSIDRLRGAADALQAAGLER